MDSASREIELVFKLIVAAIFGGMSLLFWFVNRKDDARRLEALKELELQQAANPIVPANLSPLDRLRLDFSALFKLSENPRKRGELLEGVFNRLFTLGDVSVDAPFERRAAESGKKIDEQVDGVIVLDDTFYLTEIHWEEAALGAEEIQDHLEMITSGEEESATRGVIVSFNGFTDMAIDAARKAVKSGHVLILCTLSDFTHVLEGEGHVDAFLRNRIHTATVDKNPYASYAYEAPPVEYEYS